MTHWFFLSERPSVYEWNTVEMFQSIPSFIVMAFLNCKVNLGSLSEMILVGRPNHGYTFCRYSWAIPSLVMVVKQGMKIAALEQPWSTMVSMASFPFTWGKPVIRSIAICEKGFMFSIVIIPKSGVFFLWV